MSTPLSNQGFQTLSSTYTSHIFDSKEKSASPPNTPDLNDFQIQNYLSDAFDLEEQFNKISNTPVISSLEQIYRKADFLQSLGTTIIESATGIDASSQELLLETLAKVRSIAKTLADRIQKSPPAKAILPSVSTKPETGPALETLSNMINATKTLNDIKKLETLYYKLPPEIQKKIFENLWKVRGCPTAESPIPAIRALHHEDFGLVSFFNIVRRCASTSLQKRLALELCMTPSVILEQMMEFVSGNENEFEKAMMLFDYLPEKIQETAFKNLWASFGLEGIPEEGRVAFSNFLERFPITGVKTLLLSIKKAATESEEAVNSLVESRQKEFIDATALALDPDMSTEEVELVQNLLFHDIAEELLGILDSKPFVRSTENTLTEILTDYHKRYPSLLHSRILFLFCSSAFTRDVARFISKSVFTNRSPAIITTATTSAAFRVLGGSTTVTNAELGGPFVALPAPPSFDMKFDLFEKDETWELQDPIFEDADETWELQDPIFEDAPVTEAPKPPSALVRRAPSIFGISPTDSIIDIHPKILRDCPKELTQLVAESVMKDWEVTSFITSQGVYLTDAPPYHLEMVTFELNSQVIKLEKFLKTLESNPKADDLIDLIEILEVKQKYLHEIYLKVLDDGLNSYLSSEAEIFGRLPYPLYERALVLSRIDFYTDGLKRLQDTNPRSEMIAKVQDRIKEYEKHLQTLPPYNTQKELLEEKGVIVLYDDNLLLSNFWLLPIIPNVLEKITWSKATEAFAQNLKEDISGIEEHLGKAKTYLSHVPEGGTMGAFIPEIENLEENLTRVKGVYLQINEIATLGKIANNTKLLQKASNSPLDRDVLEAIKRKIS